MKITDVLKATQTLLTPFVLYSEITRVEYFAPDVYPAVCINPGRITEDSDLLEDTTTDYMVEFDVVYFEAVPIVEGVRPAYDVLGFLDRVETIIEMLRADQCLNDTVNYFELTVDWADSIMDDNLEFIAQIQIRAMRR